MNNKVVIYSYIHKGQRVRFYRLAMQAGTIDIADRKALDDVYAEANALRNHIRLHAGLEEKVIHPILRERLPGEARKLEEDHHNVHQQFDDLIVNLEAIRGKTTDEEERLAMMLEFYRALSRFISVYLVHIDKEEELIQPALWAVCTTEDLLGAFKIFVASQTPVQLAEQLQMMLTASNLHERIALLEQGKANSPPEMFRGVIQLAQRVLEPKDWEALKTKMNID